MTKYPSVYFLIAAFVIWLAQLFPITGIFLMMMGGPFLPGLLLYLFLISFFLETVSGRLPRAFAALPVLAIAVYYVAYFQQAAGIAKLREELRRTNPGQLIRFDPAKYALVDDQISPATYDIPVVYKLNPSQPEGYSAKFIAEASICDTIKRTARVNSQQLNSTHCLLEVPRKPSGTILRIERDLPPRDAGEQKTRLYVDNILKATYRAVSVKKLARIPFYMAGCGLDSGAAKWVCFTEFASIRLRLDALQENEDRRTAPAALMLGLRRLPPFTPYNVRPETGALVTAAASDPALTQSRVMQILENVIVAGPGAVPGNMPETITHYGPSLSAKADAIADRFAQLMQARAEPVAQCLRAAMPDADDGARRLAIARPDEIIDEEKWRAMARNPATDTSGKRDAAQMLALAAQRRGQLTATQRALYKACRESQPKALDGNAEMGLFVLASALGVMPDDDFARVAPRVQKVFLLPAERFDLPYLYIRSGVAGPDAARMYKTDLATNLFDRPRYASLGLCRSGADEETLARLEKEFISLRPIGFGEEGVDREAIALALMKQGHGEFVRAHLPQMGPVGRAFYDILLSGKGWNAVGPNNCAVTAHQMAFPKAMTSLLVFEDWSDKKWHLR